MDWRFEWDPPKRITNIQKHGIDFEDVRTVFHRGLLVRRDGRRDYGEQRLLGIGPMAGRLVVIVFTRPAAGVIRIISARKANRREQKIYWKAFQDGVQKAGRDAGY